MGFEFGVELSYPMPEDTVATVLNIFGQVAACLFRPINSISNLLILLFFEPPKKNTMLSSGTASGVWYCLYLRLNVEVCAAGEWHAALSPRRRHGLCGPPRRRSSVTSTTHPSPFHSTTPQIGKATLPFAEIFSTPQP